MDSNPPQPAASNPPPKPWEKAVGSSGSAPFKPPSAGNTSDVVEASGTARPGEILSSFDRNAIVNMNSIGRPVPSRPWDQNYGNPSYGGAYGSTMNNSLYSSSYGGGMYGNMYSGGYGGLTGSSGMYGNSGMYGGGMYNNSGFGGPMGGYGMGMGGPYGGQDPNDPYGPPSSPPGFWMSFLRVMHGVVNFFGRISILIDQNTQAFHMFMSALLQLFDRSGMLYGELARFVLRLLGVKTKPRKVQQVGPDGLPIPGAPHPHEGQNLIEAPKASPEGSWDNVWPNNGQ